MARIPIAEWARRHGITPDAARRKANRGGFKTAEKVGSTWLIDENEPRINLPSGRPFKKGPDARRARNQKEEREMKCFGETATTANPDMASRVYVYVDKDKEATMSLERWRGISADGYVLVNHSSMLPGTVEAFNARIVEAAEEFMVDSGTVQKYETFGGLTMYEMR